MEEEEGEFNYCPGENSTVLCGSGCAEGSMCFSDITEGYNQCCSKLDKLCTTTGMLTYFNETQNVYQSKWSSVLDPDLYYRDQLTLMGCPIPYSYQFFLATKVKPSGFFPTNERLIRMCQKNSDCRRNEYCGASVNWLGTEGIDTTNNGKPLNFCYQSPVRYEVLEVVNRKPELGLPLCLNYTQCSNDEICLTYDEWKGKLRMHNGVPMDGVCTKAAPCVREHVSYYGRRLETGYCGTDSDCKQISEYRSAEFSPFCRQYHESEPTQKVCCFLKRDKCTHGYQNFPLVECSTTSDCNSNTTLWTNWCDPNGKCCSEDGENWASPDGATPLYNEPACEGVVEGDPTSGTCPTDINAKCLNGHCHQAGEIVNGKFVPGEYNYLTNFTCDTTGPLPDGFTYSYCNSTTNTIMKLGSIAIAKIDKEKNCQQDTDCSDDGSIYCVYITSGKGACSEKPEKQIEKSLSAAPLDTDLMVYIILIYNFYYQVQFLLQ